MGLSPVRSAISHRLSAVSKKILLMADGFLITHFRITILRVIVDCPAESV
jgi:hypothetical protein